MRINIEYLKKFIPVDLPVHELKELLAALGLEVAEIIQTGSGTVFDVEITPNRPDWLSHLGVAREIHARLPELPLTDSYHADPIPIPMGEGDEAVAVRIENPADCGRYSGLILKGLNPASSPEKVGELLESLGLRSINRVVDTSNLVLMSMGHPIHMFDLDRIAGKEIHVRRAVKGETLTLLDERRVELDPEDLVIADREKPLALAGIMGGLDSGVTEATTNVFVESACFDPVRVRLSARRLGIQTDASYRFERGADIQATPYALSMTLSLLQEWGAEGLQITGFTDIFPLKDLERKVVTMHRDFPSTYTGIEIPHEASQGILERLGFVVENPQAEEWRIVVPSHRVDILYKQDLVEEVIRIHGYDRLNSTIPRTVNTTLFPAKNREVRKKIRSHLNATGYSETLHYSFQSEEDNLRFALSPESHCSVTLRNPLGRDYASLRNSLIPGILGSSALNANHGALRVTLFEMGHRFLYHENKVKEEEMLTVAALGKYRPESWRNPGGEDYDYFLFQSEMNRLFKRFGLEWKLKRKELPWMKNGASFAIRWGDREAGWIGCLSPEISRLYGVTAEVMAMELDMAVFFRENGPGRFKEWNRMPSIRRDFSFFLPESVTFALIAERIEMNRPRELESFQLLDYYDGKKKNTAENPAPSLTLSFQYRDEKQTLTGEKANEIHQTLVVELIRSLDLVQR